MTKTLTLQSIEPVTHDVYRLRFNSLDGVSYRPGQAFDIALDKDGWREEQRPFTPTSLPDEGFLEFTIKSYPDHNGVTEQIGKMKPGDAILVDEPWGAIEDKGTGWFIAGGAGVTPFIAILRKRLEEKGTLEGCELIFSNKTEKDIILRETFEQMPGLKCSFIVTDETDSPLHREQIDADFLKQHVKPGGGKCYVCGPDAMLDDMADALKSIGVSEDDIITEEFD